MSQPEDSQLGILNRELELGTGTGIWAVSCETVIADNQLGPIVPAGWTASRDLCKAFVIYIYCVMWCV